MFCQKCGKEIKDDVPNFCPSCGEKISNQIVGKEPMYNPENVPSKSLEKKIWYRVLKVFYIFFYLCLFGGIIGALYFGISGDGSFLSSVLEAIQALVIGYFLLELIRTALRYVVLGNKPDNPIFIWALNLLKKARDLLH
jgi:hypothetical protein